MNHDIQVSRRDFLYVATGTTAAAGAAFASWPFIDQMRPDASTLAGATIDIDISGIQPGHVGCRKMARATCLREEQDFR